MKQKLTLFAVIMMAMALPNVASAYDFSYTYQGKTLYYTYYGSGVQVVNPMNGDYYSYVSGDVIIPESVENGGSQYAVIAIGENAFHSCTSLDSITIPDGVMVIGGSAFHGCTGLANISIPDGITTISDGTFYQCTGLASVIIPAGVTSIGSSAFFGCEGLTAITIPAYVASIGSAAFANCGGVTSLVVDAANTYYDSRDNCNAIIRTDLNLLVQGCNSTVIPNTVTAIGSKAFYGCTGLASAIIPDGVISIGVEAFYECSGLTSVSISNSITSIGDYVFYGCSGLTSVTIPTGVITIGSRAFNGCSGLTSVNFGDGVTSIGYAAFEACTNLTTVTIPNSVTMIGEWAFAHCITLSSVNIGSGITSMGQGVFYDCSLSSVRCQAITPPTLGSDFVFGSSCLFYVPCNSVTAYRSATYWSSHYSRIYGTPYWSYTIAFVSSNETMGSVSASTANCDSNITVTATANAGYQFTGWSDGGTGNPRTFHLSHDTVVTALFDYMTYAVIGQPNNANYGIVTGSDTVYYGDTVTLTVTPNYGYHFHRWQDYNTENPRTIVVTQNRIYTAYFATNSYSVTVQSANNAHGTATGSGTTAYLGTRSISATPATGYHFSHWSDGDSNATRTLTVTQDSTLTAYFEINNYTLTVLPNDATLGTVTGGGTYTHGTQVTVTATPTAGNRFDHWSDNTQYTPYTFTLTSNMQLMAVFLTSDTFYVDVHDTIYVQVHDTTCINVYVHDTTYVDIPYAVHDTAIVTQYDTTYIEVHYAVHDTTIVMQYDTTYVDVPYAVHDTTYVTLTDTVTNTVYDTVDNYIYDTTVVTDTLWLTEYDTIYITLYDTVYIHDTVYITEEGIGDVEAVNAKVYSSQGQIVVEGAEGNTVTLYDISGRLLATMQDYGTEIRFDAPASGTYLIKIGQHAARRVVVIR